MSVRHYKILLRMVEGMKTHSIPTNPVLMLPDHLQFCSNYNPCDFGTPTGAPSMLGPDYPVIVDGAYTYVYITMGDHTGIQLSTFAKLEEGD